VCFFFFYDWGNIHFENIFEYNLMGVDYFMVNVCDEELEFLFSLPLLCDESEKDFFRVECFKLLDKFL